MRGHLQKIFVVLMVIVSSLALKGLQAPAWASNLSTDYIGVPPYVSSTAAPNILMLLDNSASMRARASCAPTVCVQNVDGTVDNSKEINDVFLPAVRYSGYFDSMQCYAYRDGTWNNNTADVNNRFSAGTAKNTALKATVDQRVEDTCPNDQWDGNLLNWITFRRIDAVKKAMIGGECVAARNADGTCAPTAGKITIQSHRGVNLLDEYMTVSKTHPTAGDQITGRIPAAYRYAGGLYIHLRSSGTYAGWFCVDNDKTGIGNGPCDDTFVSGPSTVRNYPAADYWTAGGSVCTKSVEGICVNYTQQPPQHIVYPAGQQTVTSSTRVPGGDTTAAGFNIRLAVDTEPKGVVQQVGSQARLGLMIFQPRSGATDGGLVTVPFGARQSVDTAGNITTRNTNIAAMIDAVQAMTAQSATPLAESLYEATRYIAQLPPTFNASSYTYPFGFTGAAALGSNGIGSMGRGEITALGAGETCPPGYVNNACGRDPYFFGQNYTPAWASPSAVVPCCQTFIIIVTDGAPTLDDNIPSSLKDFAYNAGVSGTKCTGNDKVKKHKQDGTCNGRTDTSASDLLLERKTDFANANHYLDDIALWAHTRDLRPDDCSSPKIALINENGHCLPGMQNITLYTLYAFGDVSGREILMQASRQGGFEAPNLLNALPKLDEQDCTNYDGTKGRSSQGWDKINNVTGLDGPDCVPDNYFESSNSDDIRDRLFATISKILELNTSGASASVLASSSTGEGITFQAFFYQNKIENLKQLTWLGYLQGFFVDQYGNIREDTRADGKLVLKDDYVVKLEFDVTGPTPKTVAVRYRDTNGTGVGDTKVDTVDLAKLTPVWEAGRRLALTNSSTSCEGSSTWPKSGNLSDSGLKCRRILTWVDKNNNGLVDVGERLEFATSNTASLCPYLDGKKGTSCASGGSGGAGQTEAASIINFIRGIQDPTAGLRNREIVVKDDGGNDVTNVWKLGDIMSSTPVSVGAPRERYDIIYGDEDYALFYQRYKDRRQVVYVGANDGMLHAFNAGFLSAGVATDNERLRYTTTPMKPGSNTACGQLPCDAPAYDVRSSPAPLGAELWAYIPQDLLPQLRWLTDPTYGHTYYVDLKPKVTEARIFTPDADHPGGWGTILIGGMRFGGSCSNCNQVKGSARTVTGDFGSGGQTTRVFLSSYFVLDITNPEKDPTLLWTFRDQDLGLTTAAPAVIRMNTGPGTSSNNEKWYAVFGTGMTHYDGSSNQVAQAFVVDLKLGPSYMLPLNQTSGTVRGKACAVDGPCLAAMLDNTRVALFSTGNKGFMGDTVSLDANLDFRVDVIYLGSVFCNTSNNTNSPCNGNSPTWKGAMWRLTTDAGQPNLTAWGVSNAPTKVISSFACQGTTCSVGPSPAAAALSIDDKDNFWVFFGTGRLITNLDNTNADKQNFFGVKDCIASNACSNQKVERNNLFDVSNVEMCTDCTSTKTVSMDGGRTFTKDFDTLLQDMQSKDGWFTTLAAVRERSLSMPLVLGGTLFFGTFSPGDSVCDFSGDGRLYGLFFMTGTGYKSSALGDSTGRAGNQIANRFIDIESGMPSQVALHLGGRGNGASGTATATGCTGRVTTNIQTSTATISQRCATPALAPWSRVINWRDL